MPADTPAIKAGVSRARVDRDFVPIVIDVEASGFGRGSYPIEVGVVMADGTRHCYLVTPSRDWTAWDEQAEAVHGISRRQLSDFGSPADDVAWRLNELLRGQTVYSDAWSFDMSWLGKLFEEVGMAQAFRVADVAELLDEATRRRWHHVKESVVSELGLKRHRASIDAQVVQQTWLRLRDAAA
jgi:hypothetical protein